MHHNEITSEVNATRAQWEPVYVRTTYRVFTPVHELDLRIGQHSVTMDGVLASHGLATWGFITAWYPRSQPASDADNACRQEELRQILDKRGWHVLPGMSFADDGNWPPEESFLVLGIAASEVAALGRTFGQNAVVVGTIAGAPQLEWC